MADNGLEGDLLGDGDGLYDDNYVASSDAQAFDERVAEDTSAFEEPAQHEVIHQVCGVGFLARVFMPMWSL